MTPEATLTMLDEWAANNRAKLEANRIQVQDMQRQQQELEAELRRLRTKVSVNETEEAWGGLDDLPAQLRDLARRLAQVEELAAAYSAQAEEVKTELGELQFELQFRQANAQQALYDADRFSESFPYCQPERLDFKIEYVNNLADQIGKSVQKLKTSLRTHQEATSQAAKVAKRVCEHTSFAREAAPAEARNLQRWVKEAESSLASLKKTGSLWQEAHALGNTRTVLEDKVKDLRAYEVHTKVCASVASKLSDCAKDMARIREIQKSMDMIQTGLGQSRQWLSGSVQDIRDGLTSLMNTSRGVPEIKATIEQLRKRLYAVSDTLSETGAVPMISSVPSIDCQRYDRYGIDVAGQRLPRIQSALAAGNAALAEADGSLLLVNDFLAGESLSKNLKKGQSCYEELLEIAGTMTPPVNFVDAAARAKSLLDSYLSPIQGQKVAEDFCSQAREHSESMKTLVGRIEKAEQLVGRTLRAAEELAERCLDVNDPENIRTLFEEAKQITVDIGAEVTLIINDRKSLAEKLKLAQEARSEAIAEAAVINDQVEALRGEFSNGSGIDRNTWIPIFG